jgi:hypothetical protein
MAAALPEANTEVRPPPAHALAGKSTVIGLQPMAIPETKKPDLNKTVPFASGVPSPRVVVASPVTTLESSALVDATPSAPFAPPAPKTTPLLESQSQSQSRKRPSTRSRAPEGVAVAADPFAAPRTRQKIPDGTEELAALVAKKPGKNYVFVAIGLGIAIGVGVFLKFALSDDSSRDTKSTTASQPTALAPLTPTNEIPPPPPKEDLPASPAAPVAKADPPPQPAAPTPPPHHDPPPQPRTVAVAPPPRAAAPPPRAAAAPPAPPPRPAAKPGAGGASGGIVRDNPF